MTTQTIHTEIKREIIRAFAVIDEWFDRDPALLAYRPPGGAYSVLELLERVVHANAYVLEHDRTRVQPEQSVEKGVADHWLSLLLFNELGATVNSGECFDPHCLRDSYRIRHELRDLLDRCICILELLAHGSGDTADILKDVERIEVYQGISFISIYMKCQIKNILRIEKEFSGSVCES